jgi:PDZ domain
MSFLSRIGAAGLLLLCGQAVAAQEGTVDLDARWKDISKRLRVSLEQQSRVLAMLQIDLQRAARSSADVRDSIVRSTSQRIAELSGEIARVQSEADRLQGEAITEGARSQMRVQLATARAMANTARVIVGQQRALTFMTLGAPRGRLGVRLSGAQQTEVRDGKVYTLFDSPLSIASVEPDSPASRAGLLSGDEILAFGRLSLPSAVPLAEVLKPGERLPLRIRRDGRERTVTVLVDSSKVRNVSFTLSLPDIGSGASSAGFGETCAGQSCAPSAPSGAWPTPRPPGMRPTPDANVTVNVGGARSTGGLPFGSTWSSTDYSIAGAVMTTITDDLEDLTGASEGILVLRVAPGTPAAESGLRGGDVILRVNDDSAEGVRDLQVAVQRASARGVRQVSLVVLRKRKEQRIALRW